MEIFADNDVKIHVVVVVLAENQEKEKIKCVCIRIMCSYSFPLQNQQSQKYQANQSYQMWTLVHAKYAKPTSRYTSDITMCMFQESGCINMRRKKSAVSKQNAMYQPTFKTSSPSIMCIDK